MRNPADFDLQALGRMTEDDARRFLEAQRWPDGPICPHCGVVGEAAELKPEDGSTTHARPGTWVCRPCRRQFSVTVGTVMEGSHIPLSKWMLAFYLFATSKKSLSALQLQRQLGLGSYKSAWHMAHRIRFAMNNDPSPPRLSGTVEADEMFIGGKPRRRRPLGGRSRNVVSKKVAVGVLVQRDGAARARVFPYGVTAKGIERFIRKNVDRNAAALRTDEAQHYKNVGRTFKDGHEWTNHALYEYAKPGGIHSNTAESFNGLFKRSIQGAWHSISEEHMPRYLDEQVFRWTHKKTSDADRTRAALGRVAGVRLYYKKPRRQGPNGSGESLVAG